jgi:hypothetical protein
LHNEKIQELFRQRFLGCKVKENHTCGHMAHIGENIKTYIIWLEKPERRYLQVLDFILRTKCKRKTAESLRNEQLKIIRN